MLELGHLLTPGENRVTAGEEEQRVVLIGQVDEIEYRTRLIRERAGLPDLEPPESTDHDVPRCGNTSFRIGGLTPVVERLLPVLCKLLRLFWSLHLNHADARPDQVEKPTLLLLLEVRDVLAMRSVTLEELVQERLGLAPLAPVVHAPARGKGGEPRADLLPRERHG